MAGYWPGSSSRSLDTPRKELEQYQPSSPHTCSITHIYIVSPTTFNLIWLKTTKQIDWNSIGQLPATTSIYNITKSAWEEISAHWALRCKLCLQGSKSSNLKIQLKNINKTVKRKYFIEAWILVRHKWYKQRLFTCKIQSVDGFKQCFKKR